MTEKEEKQSIVGNKEDSQTDLMSEIQKLRSEIFDKFNNADVLVKLQSIESLVSKILPEAVVATKDSVESTDLNPTMKNPEIGKSFVLKHIFKNADKFEKSEYNDSEREEHFGVEWYICLTYEDENLQFHLFVEHPGTDWVIETEFDLKITSPKKSDFTKTQNYCYKETIGEGFDDFLPWKEVEKNYLDDGNLTAEVHVKIIETKGLRKETFRNFHGSEEISDIVLVVNDRKFHVLKMFLATQSSFFKALFLGNFAESKKSEITLTGIDPEDFHFFLEVLYGEAAIDDTTVEGIMLLADMYDASTAVRRCEEFLLEKSRKTLKKKLQLADRYSLGALKKWCLSEIRTSSDLRSVIPNNVQNFEHSTVVALLEKAISVE